MSPNGSPDGLTKSRFIVGIFLILLFVGLLVFQRLVTSSYVQQDWVLLYIGIALVTGLVFWLLTASSGEFSVKELGIRLGGGAAIGASFMVLACWITKPATNCVLVPLQPPPNGQTVKVDSHDADLEVAYMVPNSREVVVVFKEGKERGSFKTKFLADNKIVYLTYWVTRAGREKKSPERTEEPIPGESP